MAGYAALVWFLLMGAWCAISLAEHRSGAEKCYLGLVMGLVMMMWLPSLAAFFTGFTVPAQHIAMGASALIALCLALVRYLHRSRHHIIPRQCANLSHPPLHLTLALVVPLVLLSAYLLHTHTILPDEMGDLHVGQSTYGDLSLHLGISTGLRGASYPPEYTLLPGTLLGYPFLADAMTTTMLLLGTSLRQAYIVTGLMMMVLVYWGFVIFAWRLTQNCFATALAYALFFLNGGLGFIYFASGLPGDPSTFKEIFTAFYKTPTNFIEQNIRWVNVICDLMIPQRTLLAGWMMVMPALLMLHEAIRRRSRCLFAALGVWAGLMPMVHTHSFLALGLISAGAMIHSLWRIDRRHRGRVLSGFALYGAIAALMALPQLLLWTLPQTVSGGSIRFIFNWVNWDESRGGLIDGYFWFWIKNVGPIYLFMIPAALHAKRAKRSLAVGALVIYIVAELMRFQPNTYDNNKLFIVAFMLMTPLCARYLVDLYKRLKGIAGRRLLAAGFVLVSVLSASLTIGREVVSDYVLFGASEAAAAYYADEHAPRDAIFLTGLHHNNPIPSLAGRKLVCGTPTFLYFHGVDYSEQMEDVQRMFESPGANEELFARYGVDYVYVSNWERADYNVDEAALATLFSLWFTDGNVRIYQVSERDGIT